MNYELHIYNENPLTQEEWFRVATRVSYILSSDFTVELKEAE